VSRRRAAAAGGAALLAVVAAAPVLARRRAAARHHVAPVAALPPLAGRERTVRTEDGVELAVVEHGAQDAPTATVLLVHGWVQSSRLWDGQVRDLLRRPAGPAGRDLDHRGHGRSGPTPRDRATLQQLGRDLAVVRRGRRARRAGAGGGSLDGRDDAHGARRGAPELLAERVAGVALVGTSAADLEVGTYDLPAPVAALARRLLPAVGELGVRAERRGLPRYVGPLDSWLLFPAAPTPSWSARRWTCTAELGRGRRGVPADAVRARPPGALQALAHVPVAVVVGDRDRLCPLSHSQALAAALPTSELTVFPGVGHMVHLERRAEVSAILLGLLDRALGRTG
jgi:pimeloyl-ACP methyl ester carboxylesterase